MTMLEELARKRCKPCAKGEKPLTREEAESTANSLPGWTLHPDGKTLGREYLMLDFMAAVDLIDRVALLAEREDHHPDVHLTGYRRLRFELSTHSIGGLSENDFILAAQIEQLPKSLRV